MDILEIAQIINRKGGRLYFVGGGVRDQLMGCEPSDQDYCVTGIALSQFAELFPHAFLTGQAFPVFRMPTERAMGEFALARKERKISPGHQGFATTSSIDVTIEQDLERRDITINAMAIDVLTNRIFDPFGGQQDLANRLIRAVSHAFAEDPLRVYRTARIRAQFEFEIEQSTMIMMHNLKNELPALSAERVFTETKKALRTEKPSLFFRTLQTVRVLDVHFSEIASLHGVLQPERYHPEGDAFEHTMQALDACAALTNRAEVRFSVLVHDVGKGITPREKWPAHHGHESRGVPLVKQLCKRLKAPTAWTNAASFATEHHMKVHILHRMRSQKIVDLLTKAQRNPLGVEGLSTVGIADVRGRNNPDASNENARLLLEMWRQIQTVNGQTIATTAKGKQFGELLRRERVKQLTEWRNRHHYQPYSD